MDDINLQICLGVICVPKSPDNLLGPYTNTGTFGLGTESQNCMDFEFASNSSNNCCKDFGLDWPIAVDCNGWVWFAATESIK